MTSRGVDDAVTEPAPEPVPEPTSRRYLSPWLLAVLVVSLAGAAYCHVYAQQEVVGEAAAFTWLCLPVLALPFSMRRGVTGVAHPWTVIFWLVVYSWVLRLTLAAIGPATSDSMFNMFGGGPQDVIFGGLFLGGLGLACFTLGYFITMSLPRRGVPKPRFTRFYRFDDRANWDPRRMEVAALFVLILSIGGLILLQLTSSGDFLGKRFNDLQGGSANRTSSAQYGYLRIAYLSHSVFIMLLVFRFKFGRLDSPLLRLMLPVSGVLAVAVPLLGNNRAGVAVILVDFLMLQILLTRRVPRVRVVFGTIAGVLAVAWMLRIRGGGTRTFSEALVSTFAGRDLFDIGKIARIHETIPGTLDGQSLWGWLVFPVPQSFLPFPKPVWTGLGQYVWVHAYGGAPGITGVPAGLIGELYLNIGTVGVMVGMCFFGILIAALYRMIYPLIEQQRVIGAVLFAIALVRLIMFGLSSDLGTGVLGSLSDFLPILVLISFVAPRPRAWARRGPPPRTTRAASTRPGARAQSLSRR